MDVLVSVYVSKIVLVVVGLSGRVSVDVAVVVASVRRCKKLPPCLIDPV